MPSHPLKETRLEHLEKEFLGVLMTIASSLCYALYSMFAKTAQNTDVPFYQISFSSFFISWLGLIPFLLYKKNFSLKTKCFHLHLLRLLFGTAIVYLFIISLK
ncbi:MAG: hypothetical protein ACM3JI_01685 [Anaerolineae bacterium]